MLTDKKYFWQNLERFTDQIALIDASTGRSILYPELEANAGQVADQIKLSNKGIVFLFTTNSINCITAYLGALKSGNAVLLLDEKLNDELRSALINKYMPEFILTTSEVLPENYILDYKFDSLLFYKKKEIFADKIFPELAVLLSTSGTTGSPKLVRLAYKNIQSNAQAIIDYLQIDSSERPVTTLPLSYSYGLSVINSHLLKGAAIILTNEPAFFRDFWNLFNEHKCTSFAGVPYTYMNFQRINFEKIKLPTLRTMTQAGGKLSDELIQRFNAYAIERKVRFYVMYGQTEATARISYVPLKKLSEKIGSIGISIPGGELKIFNEGTEVNEPNQSGEIVYKGDNVMLGYAENRSDLSRRDELKGILFTGDIGYKDEDGFFYLTGRMKRFIKIFGLRINLDEVQKMIENHFGISAACTGKDDLLQVLVSSADIRVITDVKNEILKMYKLNFKTVLVKTAKEIPTISSGKYDYSKINEIFNDRN